MRHISSNPQNFNLLPSFTFTLKQIKFYQHNSQHKLHPKNLPHLNFLCLSIFTVSSILTSTRISSILFRYQIKKGKAKKRNQADSPYHHFVITTIILHSSILLLHSSWMNKNRKMKNL